MATFDPNDLPAGTYRVAVEVTDDGNPVGFGRDATVIIVRDQQPQLEENVDSDGDGTSDADEGLDDSDGDGIEDYLDSNDDVSILPVGGDGEQVMETESGLRLKLGSTAFSANSRHRKHFARRYQRPR